ncbi:MAG: hypothetical protein WCR54_07805 [Clostridia bacterium]
MTDKDLNYINTKVDKFYRIEVYDFVSKQIVFYQSTLTLTEAREIFKVFKKRYPGKFGYYLQIFQKDKENKDEIIYCSTDYQENLKTKKEIKK